MPIDDKVYADLKRDTDAGELLWHYTDWNGLQGIVKDKGSLWATHYSCLNDTNEIVRALEVAKDHFTGHAGFLSERLKLLRAANFADLAIYLTSFSGAFDSLEQWRAYSGASSIGFALGFDRQHLSHLAGSLSFALVRCEYGYANAIVEAQLASREWKRLTEESDRIESDPSISGMDKNFSAKGFAGRQLSALPETIQKLAVFKDKCFEFEREVRLVSSAAVFGNDDDIPDHIQRKFRLRDSMVAPFLELPLRLPDLVHKNLRLSHTTPLRAILVGPMTHQHANARAAGDMLRRFTKPSGIEVAMSQLPLRTR